MLMLIVRIFDHIADDPRAFQDFEAAGYGGAESLPWWIVAAVASSSIVAIGRYCIRQV